MFYCMFYFTCDRSLTDLVVTRSLQAAANLQYSLTAHLTSAPSLTIFRQRLRTVLF